MAESDNTFMVHGIGVLNRKPLLVHIIYAEESPFPFIEAFSRELGATPALVFVTNYWSILGRSKIENCENSFSFAAYLRDYRAHRQRHPNHSVVLMANDATEWQFLHAHGIDAVHFQQSGLMHPYEMPPVTTKEFDAVYIGRIEPHKRLELAQDIRSCCVVFASVNISYFQQIRPLVSHFVFSNGDPLSSESVALPRAQVAHWCARSRSGLCLSAEEGAMWACAEYMLWGLPVVSTRSIGGRDEYFDDRYCFICDDNPTAVAAAVKEAISRNLDPQLIRHTFLAKVMERRAGLSQFIIHRTMGWEGSLEGFLRDWLDIGTPFLDGIHFFTAPQLLEELDSMQLFDGSRREAELAKLDAAFRRSTSWRVTRPLRWLRRQLL